MEHLVHILDAEPDTRGVVRFSNGELRRFRRQGVIDLFSLVADDSVSTAGALIADHVIGRGAAFLLIAGGFAEVYARMISRPALDLLRQTDIKVEYEHLVDNIRNRRGDGICPVEQLTMPFASPADADAALDAIGRFFQNLT